MFKKLIFTMVIFGCTLLFPAERLLTEDELVVNAEKIVLATVVETHSRWTADQSNIVTDVTLRIELALKGDDRASEIVLTLPGGKVGDLEQVESAQPMLQNGERVVLFLQNGAFPIVGGAQGRVLILNDRVAGRDLSLDEYLARITAALNRNRPQQIPAGQLLPTGLPEWAEEQAPDFVIEKTRKTDERTLEPQSQITAVATLLNDGFESGFPTGLWTRSANTNSGQAGYGYTWEEETYNPKTGVYSLWCAGASLYGKPDLNPAGDNYPNNMNAWAVYGPFDLSDAYGAQVTFDLWLESESGKDYFKWMSSINGSSYSGYLQSGTSGGWVSKTYDLTLLCGNATVWLAFIFQSDAANAFKGAFVDNVVLTKQYVDPTEPNIDAITPGEASAGTNTQVTLTGNNFGATQGAGKVEFFYRSGQAKLTADIISWSNTNITCVVPRRASSGPVSVTNNDGKTGASKNIIITFGYGGVYWNTNDVRYYINENEPNITGEGDALQSAAHTWTHTGGADFNFTYIGPHSATGSSFNGKNEMLWAPLGPTAAIAVATTWFNGNMIAETDIRFNSDYAWGIGVGSFYDVETIALHELGHWLNLNDVYGSIDSENDAAKVMYGYGFQNNTKRDLRPAEQAGILFIYGGETTFDDNWASEELTGLSAQLKAQSGTVKGSAAVHEEKCPLVTTQSAVNRWWTLRASSASFIRLYYTDDMLIDAGFSHQPVIAHYRDGAWHEVATGAPQSAGSAKYVESTAGIDAWSPFTLFEGENPIAVNLLSFQAVAQDDRVIVNWATASEVDRAGFNVWRSDDAKADFVRVNDQLISSWEKGAVGREYTFVDQPGAGGACFYKLEEVDLNGVSAFSDAVKTQLSSTVASDDLPTAFRLLPNYPNPFNPQTTITFELPQDAFVDLTIYRITGQVAARLLNEPRPAGRHQLVWDAEAFAGGVYLLRLKTEGFTQISRLLLIK